MSKKGLAGYLGAMLILGGIVAAATWFIAGWLGAEGDARIIITSQAPVFAVLILWAVALAVGPAKPL